MLCLSKILDRYQNRKTLDLILRVGTSAEGRYISNKVTCFFNKPKYAADSFSLNRKHLMGVDGVLALFD